MAADAVGGGATVALIIAIFGFLGVTVAPIALALINRGSKSKELAPEVAVPRIEYDNLLEQLSRLDEENDRLARENSRLTSELKDEELAHLKSQIERDEAIRVEKALRRRRAK